MTLESTHSTHANRRGSDDFKLKIRDICWDMPLTAPVMSKATYELNLWHIDNSQGVPLDLPTMSTGLAISWSP